MTRESLVHASREDLIEQVLCAHADLESLRMQSADRDARIESLEHQPRWFQKQLFGRKSERQIPEPDPAQLCLGEAVAPDSEAPVATTTVRSHARRKRPEFEALDESGLRFDDTVPVRTIEIPNPELDALPEDERTEINEKVTYRLAQEPGAYVVLKFVRKVVKRADTGALCCPPAPPSVLEKSYADVSLLAGMLVDKFRYHLPLYRQH